MNETSSTPTRLLRATAAVVRWAWWLLLAAWLLVFAAWGALHGWIVPRIDEFRPRIEAQAARVLGIPVHIGAVAARTEGLVPTLEFTDVVLSDPAGREALRLPRVVASLSPRSLWQRGFEQLYLEAPVLDVRRAADGRIVVAGVALAQNGDDDGRFADWLFAQPEVLVRGGALRWTDELRGAPPLELSQVDIVVRRRGWRHEARIDATPPPAWGDRFTAMGRFRQPLLTTHPGRWSDWNGEAYADFSRVDVSQLRRHADLGDVEVASGRGAVRAWADVRHGSIAGGTADVALAGVNARLGAGLEPLVLATVAGRLGGRRLDGGFELSTTGLQFTTGEGVHWPGGNVSLRYTQAGGPRTEAQGELRADRLDLGALAGIATRLPLGDALRQALRAHAPQGLVEALQARWQGPETARRYQAQGRVTGLALAAVPDAANPAHAGVPGLRGAAVDFNLTQAGGRASLRIDRGALELPGVFEEPDLPLDRLAATVTWQRDGAHLRVDVPRLSFANADAAGTAHGSWHTADANASASRSRFPGVLDLAGALDRADGTRVHRYLPQSLGADVRHYVRDAVQAGHASSVDFRVKGDLHDIPFRNPRHGEFRIAARLQDVTYAFVPPGHQHSGDPVWPALTQLAGELVFEREGMRVNGASGRFAGSPDLRVVQADAQIPDLHQSVLAVSAQAQGPAAQLLTLVGASPLARMTDHALDHASATGNAGYRFQLSMPLAHADQARVSGSITLAGNDLRVTPDTPQLVRTRGLLNFSDSGFSLVGVQARAFGGDVRIEGGLRAHPPAGEPSLALRVQGTATAEGLRQAPELGVAAQLARSARGSAGYTALVGVRRGVPELLVTSNLAGMALDLPAPFAKKAEASLPLRFESALSRESAAGAAGTPLHDQLRLEWGRLATVTYQRDLSGTHPRVLRGGIAVGLPAGEAVAVPATGVAADIRVDEVNFDTWSALLDTPADPARPAVAAAAPGAPAPAAEASPDYLPTSVSVRARALTLQGRTLHDVTASASRERATWRTQIDARELAGFIAYRHADDDGAPAGVYARLKRLAIPQSAAGEVETLLDEQPASLPTLDVVAEDFELLGHGMGRLEIQAQHRGGDSPQREWRLSRLDVAMPEAHFSASGSWAARRTAMDFRLGVQDAGGLLARLGQPGTFRGGRGSLDGRVAWHGSPIAIDYPSMSGQIHVDMAAGQFLKADPGLAKLLGVLSLQSLPRRLALDFRDVFSQGFAFDFVRGDVHIERGIAATNNLQMKGVSAAVLMEGSADIDRETQNLRVVVVPEINAGTASLVATVINPAVGLGTFLAQMFLRGPLIEAATQEFRIDGAWSDPHVARVPGRERQRPPPATPPTETETTP